MTTQLEQEPAAIYQIHYDHDELMGDSWLDVSKHNYDTYAGEDKRVLYTSPPNAKAIRAAALMEAVEACEARAKAWDDLNKEHAASYAGELRFMAIRIQSLIAENDKE